MHRIDNTGWEENVLQLIKYEKKINDVIIKCPIEAGVEILVYNVLDEIIDSNKFALVDINRIWKNKDQRLTTPAGIADIAVLSNDFVFGTDKGKVYGFVEIKATNTYLTETEQVEGQKCSVRHYIYTNGLVWKYYKDQKLQWEKYLDKEQRKAKTIAQEVLIDQNSYDELIVAIKEIKWDD